MLYIYVTNEEKFAEDVTDDSLYYERRSVDVLHPNDQFEFALSIINHEKDSVFDMYINTYSPVFVESIEVLAESKNVPVKFYYGDEAKVPDEMYEVYNYLGDVFDKINNVRIRNNLGIEYDGEDPNADVKYP